MALSPTSSRGSGGSGATVTISDTDPGAIGAGNIWMRTDPDGTYGPMLYVRDAANDDWLDEDNAGVLVDLAYYDNLGVVQAAVYGSSGGNVRIESSTHAVFTANGGNPAILGQATASMGVSGTSIQATPTTLTANAASANRIQVGGNDLVNAQAGQLGFFGAAAAAKPSVTGALSTVIDPAAKAVLTSLLAALVTLGLASDGTT